MWCYHYPGPPMGGSPRRAVQQGSHWRVSVARCGANANHVPFVKAVTMCNSTHILWTLAMGSQHGLTTWAHNTEDTEVKKRQSPPPKKRRSPFPVFGGEGEKKEEEQCKKDQYRKRCPSLSSLSTFAVPLLWHFHLPSACCSVERQCGVIASTELGKQTLP